MQDDGALHWTAEWLEFGFANITTFGVAGVAILSVLFGYRAWKFNRPVLTGRRQRWWRRVIRGDWWRERYRG